MPSTSELPIAFDSLSVRLFLRSIDKGPVEQLIHKSSHLPDLHTPLGSHGGNLCFKRSSESLPGYLIGGVSPLTA